MLEKLTNPDHARQWAGNIPVQYVYTAGVAGETFLRTLKDRGELMSSRCPECETVYLPCRLYCEQCLEETGEYRAHKPRGVIHACTIAHLDVEQERLEPPQLYAFVRFPGTDGGLIHRLGEIGPDQVYIGMEVEAILRPQAERTGSINDIAYFKPVD